MDYCNRNSQRMPPAIQNQAYQRYPVYGGGQKNTYFNARPALNSFHGYNNNYYSNVFCKKPSFLGGFFSSMPCIFCGGGALNFLMDYMSHLENDLHHIMYNNMVQPPIGMPYSVAYLPPSHSKSPPSTHTMGNMPAPPPPQNFTAHSRPSPTSQSSSNIENQFDEDKYFEELLNSEPTIVLEKYIELLRKYEEIENLPEEDRGKKEIENKVISMSMCFKLVSSALQNPLGELSFKESPEKFIEGIIGKVQENPDGSEGLFYGAVLRWAMTEKENPKAFEMLRKINENNSESNENRSE